MNSLKFYKCIFSTVFLLSWMMGVSQTSHNLVIEMPDGVAGTYGIQAAAFGPSFCDYEMVGPASLQLVTDTDTLTTACVEITDDLTGKIAIVDRGGCSFVNKMIFAQDKGAIAVIICNNTGGIFGPAGDDDPSYMIPTWMALQSDCDLIKMFLDGGLEATVQRGEAPVFLDPEFDTDRYFYTEDFNDGPNGWTSEAIDNIDSLWFWVDDATVPSGGAFTNVESVCGGAMVFPAFGSLEYHTALVSPPIDASMSCDVVVVQYDIVFWGGNATSTRTVPDLLNPGGVLGFPNAYVQYSQDDGVHWSGAVDISTTYPGNVPIHERTSVALPGAGGADSLMIRFVYNQDFSYMGIDNVAVFPASDNDLQAQDNFYAGAPNFITPASQVQPMAFLIDIRNVGCNSQPNTFAVVNITNEAGDTIFTDMNPYGNTAGGGPLLENAPFPSLYTPPAIPGTYNIIYSLTSDNVDDNPANNEQSIPFVISEGNTFAKENGPTDFINAASTNWEAGENTSWGYGNHFYVPNGDGYEAQSIDFAIANAAEDAGKILQINLYQWQDDNVDFLSQSSERTLVGFFDYEITGTENGEIITVNLEAENGDDKVLLSDGMSLVAMAERKDDDTNVEILMLASTAILHDVNYTSMALAFDSLATLANDSTLRRYGSLGYLEDGDDVDFNALGAFNQLVPVVRLTVVEIISDVDDPLADENILEVFPNPSRDQINLNILLTENETQARVNIIDITGKVVRSFEYVNVQNDAFTYEIGDFADGVYLLQYVSETGSRTLKFMKQ